MKIDSTSDEPLFGSISSSPFTSTSILGVRIDEPMTTLTDLMVSAICLYAFYQIHVHHSKNRLNTLMKLYFLSMSIATALGGLIGHGFLYLFTFSWKLPGWLTSMFSIALLERASIEYCKPHIARKGVFKFFTVLNFTELLAFVTITFLTLNFFYVEIHSSYGLLIVVTGFHGFIYLKTKSPASGYALIAVFASVISAIVYMNGISFHRFFNHYDLSHVFMMVSAWFFYQSATAMEYGYSYQRRGELQQLKKQLNNLKPQIK